MGEPFVASCFPFCHTVLSRICRCVEVCVCARVTSCLQRSFLDFKSPRPCRGWEMGTGPMMSWNLVWLFCGFFPGILHESCAEILWVERPLKRERILGKSGAVPYRDRGNLYTNIVKYRDILEKRSDIISRKLTPSTLFGAPCRTHFHCFSGISFVWPLPLRFRGNAGAAHLRKKMPCGTSGTLGTRVGRMVANWMVSFWHSCPEGLVTAWMQ